MKQLSTLLLIISFIFGILGIWTIIKPAFQRVYKHSKKEAIKWFGTTYLYLTLCSFIGSIAFAIDSGYVDTLSEWIWTSIGLFCCWSGLFLVLGLIGLYSYTNSPSFYLDRDMTSKNNIKKAEK